MGSSGKEQGHDRAAANSDLKNEEMRNVTHRPYTSNLLTEVE